MYCDYYGFREKPFAITPNPRFIFLSKNHREAFAHLLYGIDGHAGFIGLTGEVGTGKTTVLRTLLGQLGDERYRTALIFNPALSALELLRGINREYGIPCEGLGAADLLDALNRFLLEENRAGRTVVLVIDEAQNLEPQVLEQIRLISNLETETDKLIQIVLAGQPELGRLLERPELRQLSQRITVRYSLSPMDFEDTKAYIGHRLEVAGGKGMVSISPAALKRIFRYSGGFPRLINIVCDRALLIAYSEERREVSARTAAAAVRELAVEGGRLSMRRRALPASLFLLALLAVLGAFWKKPWGNLHSAPQAARADLTASLRAQLGSMTEAGSAVEAFNALALLWKVRPVALGGSIAGPDGLEKLAGQQELRLTRFNGSLGALLRIDSPALLEFTLPGIPGRRYLAVTGEREDRLTIAPPLSGRDSLTKGELEGIWSGRAYLPWRNFHKIPPLAARGFKGEAVGKLQKLLREAGAYKGSPTGVMDSGTTAAVRDFQQAHGITPDGKVGAQTLLLLYRDSGAFPVPRLTHQGGERK